MIVLFDDLREHLPRESAFALPLFLIRPEMKGGDVDGGDGILAPGENDDDAPGHVPGGNGGGRNSGIQGSSQPDPERPED